MSERRQILLLSLLLVAAVLLCFGRSIQFSFVAYDDPGYLENSVVRGGLTWDGVRHVLTRPVMVNYHPLTMLSHMLDVQLFGVRPGPMRLHNLLLHGLNAALLLVLLHRLTGSVWRSFLASALFALHPLRVESVVWISERKDVLSGLLGILTLLAYVRYARAQAPAARYVWYLLAFVLLLLGLLAKPMLVTWPLVMLLLDYWPLGRLGARMRPGHTARWPALALEKLPFMALSLGSAILTYLAQRADGAVASHDQMPLLPRFANAVVAYASYLRMLLWPSNLAVIYPHPGHWPVSVILFSGLMVGAITFLALSQRRRHPYVVWGWLWYLLTLLPVLGLVQAGAQAYADRYTYLPAIGLSVAAAWLLGHLARRWTAARGPTVAAALLLLVALSAAAFQQMRHWEDSVALFSRAIAVTRSNWVAHSHMAIALEAQGDVQAALEHAELAVAINPRSIFGRIVLADLLLQAGSIEAAAGHSRAGLSLDPRAKALHVTLAACLLRRGNEQGGRHHLLEALRLDPDYVPARNNMGVLLLHAGRPQEAVAHFHVALRHDPRSKVAHTNLAAAYERLGQAQEAMRHWRAAAALAPEEAQVQMNSGVQMLKLGHCQEAVVHLERACRLAPQRADVHWSLGRALAGCGRVPEATARYQEALRLQPEFAEAHNSLGVALAQLGDLPGAVRHFHEALRLRPDLHDAQMNLRRAVEEQPATADLPLSPH